MIRIFRELHVSFSTFRASRRKILANRGKQQHVSQSDVSYEKIFDALAANDLSKAIKKGNYENIVNEGELYASRIPSDLLMCW